jgi:hypothetical protein
MIKWDYLIQCIEKLQTLPNGSGCEIEFTYNGVEYGIVSYKDHVDFSIIPTMFFDGKKTTYSDEENYIFKSMRELGKANIYGFVLEDIWDTLPRSDYSIQIDFDGEEFEYIYESYEKACKKKKR